MEAESRMGLNSVNAGSEATIASLEGDAGMVARLQELGFIPGESVRVRLKLLFGGPLVVEIRGSSIALRQEEASCVRV